MSADSIENRKPPSRQINIPLPAIFRNIYVLQVIAQIIFVVLFVTAIVVLWSNISTTLADRNLVPSFAFLNNRAGFDISEKPAWYTPNNTYGEAFTVGIINTLRVVGIGLVMATIIGVLLGIFLLSGNWLIRTISRVYVEILRNTPLLVQLFFWYFVVMFSLPIDDITLPAEGVFILSPRVFAYPILLFLAWVLMNREVFYRRALEGALIGVILTEVTHWLFGGDMSVSLALGAAGAALLFIARTNPWGMERGTLGQWQGIGFAWAGQAVAVIIAGVLGLQSLWWEIFPAAYISRRSFVFPEFVTTGSFIPWAIALGIGLILAIIAYRYIIRQNELTGRLTPAFLYAFLLFVAVGVVSWVILSAQPEPAEVTLNGVVVDVATARADGTLGFYDEAEVSTQPIVASLPERGRFRFNIGSVVSPEYMALLLGLVIYTSAFIGEIVRAGIQAVSYGQLEAARALGLTMPQTLRMVILPQALRLIIPPMGNQYLNLSKNSSLAIAVAYADTYQIGQTMMNQSGQSVTGFFMILVTYLTMSLVISVFMNIVNSRFQLVTR